MSSIVDSIRSVKNPFTSSEEAADSGGGDNEALFDGVKKNLPKLSFKQRAIGFGVCFGLAALFAILGCALWFASTATMGVLFTLGTIAGICSTFFLVGPISQLKGMCDKHSVPRTIIKICCVVTLLAMIVLVFCSAFWWKIGGIVILFCVVQFIAIIVYAVTLIPFAMTFITRGARSVVS